LRCKVNSFFSFFQIPATPLSSLNGTLFSEIYARYLDLIAQYPDILDIISLRDIASYLLITPVYLSRIRKNLAKKYVE